jgi:hypothetical protein
MKLSLIRWGRGGCKKSQRVNLLGSLVFAAVFESWNADRLLVLQLGSGRNKGKAADPDECRCRCGWWGSMRSFGIFAEGCCPDSSCWFLHCFRWKSMERWICLDWLLSVWLVFNIALFGLCVLRMLAKALTSASLFGIMAGQGEFWQDGPPFRGHLRNVSQTRQVRVKREPKYNKQIFNM